MSIKIIQQLDQERLRCEQLREALIDVLDGLGALSNHSELTGFAIPLERAEQIVALAKGK